ncbi:MAG: HEAT repeat domain-containing protein [Thermodesulfovibrionales bacterium]|nr:HEAT repeat domain-containing protein [Thermodesulfovibrionales bacterium]
MSDSPDIPKNPPEDMPSMIADHMEAGFLENIIDMFKHDSGLFLLLGQLMADERGRVRLGAVALVEELKEEYGNEIIKAIPHIGKLLKDPAPVIRADAAYLLGIIGSKDAFPYLTDALSDENRLVRQTVSETIEDMSGTG